MWGGIVKKCCVSFSKQKSSVSRFSKPTLTSRWSPPWTQRLRWTSPRAQPPRWTPTRTRIKCCVSFSKHKKSLVKRFSRSNLTSRWSPPWTQRLRWTPPRAQRPRWTPTKAQRPRWSQPRTQRPRWTPPRLRPGWPRYCRGLVNIKFNFCQRQIASCKRYHLVIWNLGDPLQKPCDQIELHSCCDQFDQGSFQRLWFDCFFTNLGDPDQAHFEQGELHQEPIQQGDLNPEPSDHGELHPGRDQCD